MHIERNRAPGRGTAGAKAPNQNRAPGRLQLTWMQKTEPQKEEQVASGWRATSSSLSLASLPYFVVIVNTESHGIRSANTHRRKGTDGADPGSQDPCSLGVCRLVRLTGK